MWVIVSTSKTDEKHPILGDKKYVVGRTGCEITINDPSVSRKQAVLMMAHYEANVVKSFITPSLTVEDTSKFGTFVNGESVKKKPGSVMTLKDGDKIQFGGSPASVFIARYEPFVATTSCLEKIPKKNLQRVMCLLGGHVVRDWRATCDLLIMAKINVTIKVICAINNQKPIVTPDYLDHFHQFLMEQRDSKPDPKDYLPEVADKEVPAGVSFHPDVRRATLLKDLKFYFLSAHQFNKTNLAVSTAGGLPILLEDGTEEDADVMTQEGTIVVAVTRDVLSTLSSTCQKFVRTVCLVLKKKNLRMVTDPEIGWAILTCNTDDFCNPKSAITPSMYSSMASQSLSQMTDIDMDMSQQGSNTQQHAAAAAAAVSQQQLAASNNTQHTITQPHQASSCKEMLPPPPQPPKTDARLGKRPAASLESDSEDLFSGKVKMSENDSSFRSPANKRIKQDTEVSPSQQSLFSGTTEKEGSNNRIQTTTRHSHPMYSAPVLNSLQTPSVIESEVNNRSDAQSSIDNSAAMTCRSNRKKNGLDNEQQYLSSSIISKDMKETGAFLTKKSDRKIASSVMDTHSVSNTVTANDCDNEAVSNDSSSLSSNNNKQYKNNTPQRSTDLSLSRDLDTSSSLFSGGEKSISSPSPGRFLNKKVDNNNGNNEKESSQTPSPSLSTSTKGKRKKKRALFCGSSDEDDSCSSTPLPIAKKGKQSVTDVHNNMQGEDNNRLSRFAGRKGNNKSTPAVESKDSSVSDTKHDIVTEHDLPSSSSVVCNGDVREESNVDVKQEVISPSSSSSSAQKSDGRKGVRDDRTTNSLNDSSNLAAWSTVKKEENASNRDSDDEQKTDTDLVRDSNGRLLRHLCQVKVVELVAKVPAAGSQRAGKDRAANTSQQQTGAKNFKRFKKTVHCGSTGLPTIIGGRDLEPHKGARFNQMDDLMEEAVTAGNGGRQGRNNNGMFNWQEDDLAPKRRGKKT